MFALIALVCFFLALVHVHIGTVDLVALGLACLALHLLTDIGVPWRRGHG